MTTGADNTGSVTTVTTVRIDTAKLERLRTIAERNQRTVSQELRWLVDRHIAADDELEAALAA